MAYFAKTSTGYFNVDAVAFIAQQVGGAYRIRWTDGTSQVVGSDDGDAVMEAINGAMAEMLENARAKAIEIFKAEQEELANIQADEDEKAYWAAEMAEGKKRLAESEKPKRKPRTTKKTA